MVDVDKSLTKKYLMANMPKYILSLFIKSKDFQEEVKQINFAQFLNAQYEVVNNSNFIKDTEEFLIQYFTDTLEREIIAETIIIVLTDFIGTILLVSQQKSIVEKLAQIYYLVYATELNALITTKIVKENISLDTIRNIKFFEDILEEISKQQEIKDRALVLISILEVFKNQDKKNFIEKSDLILNNASNLAKVALVNDYSIKMNI